MNAPKCCIRVSFTFVRDKVKTMCACTRQTTVCQFVCETKVDKNNSVWDNSKIRCARLFFSCASLSCTRFFCAVQFRDLLHRLRYFSRKMCMNWTIWVLIQSHLLPILFPRPNLLSDAPTFPPKSVFKRWLELLRPFVDPIFRDKVFIIRKLPKFLSGLNSWFLLILRIQTDWLHGAQWALLIDPCFVTKCLLSANSRSFF